MESQHTARNETGLVFAVHTAEDLAKCVVMLERDETEKVDVDGKEAEVWLRVQGTKRCAPKVIKQLGSGFLVATRTGAFLVTAAHVAARMDGEARLVFGSATSKRAAIALSNVLGLRTRKVNWTRTRHADVAVVHIAQPPAMLHGRFLSGSLLMSENAVPESGLELTTFGFPLGLTTKKYCAPFAKCSHASSGVMRFSGDDMTEAADFFLLDQPSMGGYSGAPVFLVPQLQLMDDGQVSIVKPRCVGLVSRTISDETAGQFAAVVPAAAIRRAMAKARPQPHAPCSPGRRKR